MIAMLLWACAPEVDGEGGEVVGPDLDVDVYPRSFTVQYGTDVLDGTTMRSLSEIVGSIRIESHEAIDLPVSGAATHRLAEVGVPDENADPFIDVTFKDSWSDELSATHTHIDVDVWALGLCIETDCPTRGLHTFDLEVLVGGYSFPIEAQVMLD